MPLLGVTLGCYVRVGNENGRDVRTSEDRENVRGILKAGRRFRLQDGKMVSARAPGVPGPGRTGAIRVMIVKNHAFGSQGVQVRRANPRVAVASQVAEMHTTQSQNENFHPRLMNRASEIMAVVILFLPQDPGQAAHNLPMGVGEGWWPAARVRQVAGSHVADSLRVASDSGRPTCG